MSINQFDHGDCIKHPLQIMGFTMCFPWGLIRIICLQMLVVTPFVGFIVRDGLVPTYTVCGIAISFLLMVQLYA